MLFVMMQKRQRKKIGQYIQAKSVNGFSLFLIYIKQSQYEQIQKKEKNNQIDDVLMCTPPKKKKKKKEKNTNRDKYKNQKKNK